MQVNFNNAASGGEHLTVVKQAIGLYAARFSTFVSIIACAAVAGFFYAYACSVMYGLDDSSAITALEAMQGINRTVRNPIFAASFFGTALLLPLAAVLNFISGAKQASGILAVAALTYIGGGLFLTMSINVPMNEALSVVDVSALKDPGQAWKDYNEPWSYWNWLRTAFSFLALMLAVFAFGHNR